MLLRHRMETKEPGLKAWPLATTGHKMLFLVTEDDPALGAFLKKALAIEGYEVDLAVTGQGCLNWLKARSYDLLLLDLSLPDMDGADLLSRIDGVGRTLPAIVLSGRTQVEERVRCLDLGADDFLLKPFNFGELTARCRAAVRRGARKLDSALRQGELTLNRLERKVAYAGVPVELTPKEFALLEVLMLRGGACCTRQELLQQVWNNTRESETNVVDVYINYLRRKLTSAALQTGMLPQTTIQTVRGSGYCLTTALASEVPSDWVVSRAVGQRA